ncbi:strawberry notch C-terminal domain-containing protein [Oxalobacter aliiformigenes]|nr:LPD38 domain-containing protein [Oxalobacter aliiformigenes]WAV99663.1 strawberry notch C-terminal domain-containing protein [Oxalobacter aliiformigenes]
MLTESGQYIRREKSFEGASMDTVPVNVDIRTSDRISAAMEKIMFFSSVFQNTVEEISKDLKMAGRASGMKKGVGNVGAQSTSFGSVMHNLVSVSTMASKVEATIDAVEQAVKNGEKPVVTLSNTLGSAIEEYARNNGLKNGEKIDLNFRDLIGTYLEKTRTIRVTEPGASESKDYYVEDKEMGSAALEAYRAARAYIDKLDISLPVSPIDAIKDGLAKRGIRAGEITGRSHGVSYESDTPSYRTREPGVAEKQKAAIGFNAGDLDCIIINQSGSTGISLHASEKFADQRRRNMIILQPDLNIDVFMQTLGRVFRTGQVVPPKYSFLLSDIPSERRPAAVLGKKMSSLNANTTASAKGTQSFANIPDFLNVYGDQAAAQVLSEDAELNARLGHPLSAEDKTFDGLVARMTGRIPLLSAKEQSDVYDRLESAYKDIIELANATGTNILDTTSKPLDAREISSQVYTEGSKTGSPFDTESRAVTYDVKRLGKPFKSEEVKKHIAEGMKAPVKLSELESLWKAYSGTRESKPEFPAKARDEIQTIAARLHVGAPVRVNTSNGTTVGIVVGIQNTNKKGQNPYALSRWKLVIDLADAKRRISIPFSKISMTESATEDKFSVVPFTGKSIDELYKDFDEGQSESRETRTIIVGNLVRAFDVANGKGEIITFDTASGERLSGLMLPRGTSVDKMLDERPVKFDKGKQALAFFDKARMSEITTRDASLSIDNHYGYHVRTPSAKAVGGKHYLDHDILKITGEFTKSGVFMRAELNRNQVEKLVELMNRKNDPLFAKVSRDIAREVTGKEKTEGTDIPAFSRSPSRQGVALDEVRRIADDLAREYKNAPELVVVEKASDLPFDAPDDAKGAYINGRCFLVASNLDTAEDARITFAHEVIGHYGLNGFFGQTVHVALGDILLHNKNVQAAAKRWIEKNQDYLTKVKEDQKDTWTSEQFRQWRKNRATEEALAEMAQRGEKVTGVKKLVYAIQKILRAIGLGNLANKLESKTDAEALMALHKAELFVRSGKNIDAATTTDVFASFSRHSQSPDYSRTGVFDAAESFAVPQITILDNIIRAMQDKDIDVRRIQDGILKSGGEISENQDVYLNETLYTSRMSDRLRRLNEDWTKPILEAVQKSGLTLDEAGNWLYARHVIQDDVNSKLAEINPDREDNDRLAGISDDEAQDILDRHKNNKALEKLGELSDKLARRNVMWLVNGGLITKEEAKAWTSKYEHYVPLKRDSDIPETQSFGEFLKNPLYGISEKATRRGNVSGTRNMETRGKESKRRMGGTSRATNIIANMIANATTTIMRTEKAIVGRSMLDLARANPNPDLWEVDTPEKVKRINRDTGLVEITYRDPNFIPAENILVVKENGVEHWIKFNKNNPRAMAIAKSMKGMDAAAMNWLTQSIGATTRYMARWITSRNPVFMLFNLQRDVQHAMFNLSDTPLSGKEGQVLKNILPAMHQYHNLLRGNGEKAGYADEFREAGAETGFVKTFESIHDHVKDLQKELDKMNRSKANPMVYVEKTVKAIDDYNSIVENGVRLAVYTVARENGQSIRQAAKIAKEITVDFNRRGTHSGFINSLYMFTNASIQGHARLIRALAKSKKARVMAAGLVGLGFVMDMVGRALLGDDDETGLKVWDEIPEFDKERYWIIPVPKDLDKDGYIKIPMPQGLHVLPNIGRMLSEWCFSSRKKGFWDMTLRAGLLLVDAFNPFGAASSPGQFIVPTVAKPVVQLSENRSFAGQKVFRDETPYGGYTPPAYQRAWSNIPEHWTKLSKMLNDVTGGDDVKPGNINIPPEAIRLIVNSYLLPGTSGNIDKLAGALEKDKTTAKDWPILSRMYGTAPDEREKERAVYDRLSDLRDDINVIKEYRKLGRLKEARESVKELGNGDFDNGLRIYKGYDAFTDRLQKLNRAKRIAEKKNNEVALKNIETARKRMFSEFLRRKM